MSGQGRWRLHYRCEMCGNLVMTGNGKSERYTRELLKRKEPPTRIHECDTGQIGRAVCVGAVDVLNDDDE